MILHWVFNAKSVRLEKVYALILLLYTLHKIYKHAYIAVSSKELPSIIIFNLKQLIKYIFNSR